VVPRGRVLPLRWGHAITVSVLLTADRCSGRFLNKNLCGCANRVILRPVIIAKGTFRRAVGVAVGLTASLLLIGQVSAVSQRVPAGGHPGAPVARKSAEFEALPLLRSRQNHLLVRAYINGKPAWLGVDSGAPVTAIAANRREYFRLGALPTASKLPNRLQINGAYNNVSLVHNFRLGTLNLVDEPVVIVNLGSSSRAARMVEEQQIDGILGADILFPTKAVLDCKRQLLVLKIDPDLPGHAPGIDYRGFKAVPMQVSEGFNLYVNATINDRPARLMVDTGAFATLLHRPFVRQMHIPTRQTPFSSAAVNLKQRGVDVARIRKLTVGSIDIMGREVGVIDMEGLIHDGLLEGTPPVAGLLGAEILDRHHGIIDFGTKTLYLHR
jgi:predicted aspartyl protease